VLEMPNKKDVSTAVVHRLARYYRCLLDMKNRGVGRVSSKILAEVMGLTASQIRQDLNCFGGFGQQGYGYNVDNLIHEIAVILNLDKGHTAVVVGAGNLGHALLNNFNFARAGVRVAGAFDTDPKLIGTVVGGVTIRAIGELEPFVQSYRPDIAVLTLPRIHAVPVAELLCQAGIRGFWNFTSADLSLPSITVPVENVHFSESLMTLSYRL